MRVCARFFGVLREAASTSEVWLELPTSAKLRDALRNLSRQLPQLGQRFSFKDGSLPQYVNVVLNGKIVLTPEDLDMPLNNGDVLALIPPIAGG